MSTTMLHIRIDERMKAEATETLSAMGLSVSDAVRVFLTRVVAEQRIPFVLEAPNAETRSAMAEADEILKSGRRRFHNAQEMFAALDGQSETEDGYVEQNRKGS